MRIVQTTVKVVSILIIENKLQINVHVMIIFLITGPLVNNVVLNVVIVRKIKISV